MTNPFRPERWDEISGFEFTDITVLKSRRPARDAAPVPPAITATDLPASMSPTGPYRIAMVCTGKIQTFCFQVFENSL